MYYNDERIIWLTSPESEVHGANMGLTWVLSAPDGPHFGPMNLAIREHTIRSARRCGNNYWEYLTRCLSVYHCH